MRGVYTHLRSPSAHAPVAHVIQCILSLYATVLMWHVAHAAFRGEGEEGERVEGGRRGRYGGQMASARTSCECIRFEVA